MPNPTFKFPDTDDPTTTIEFPRGEFQGDVAVPETNQQREFSQNKELLTRSVGPILKRIPFTCQVAIATQGGNTADWDKIVDFFDNIVEGSVRPFYFTNTASEVFKVKIMDPVLPLTNDFPAFRQLRFDLKEVE